MSDEKLVLYTVENQVATITLNRPQAYNALTRELHRALLAAFREAERDDGVRAVVLSGAGKAFCSGQDLREVPLDGSLDLGAELRASYNPLILKIRGLGKPVVCAVNGPAAGAGMSLTLACDIRLAAEGARFATAFVKIGLMPDAGMTYFLPRIVGHARALELCMTGGELDAPAALTAGLVSAVHPAEELPGAAQALAERLAGGPALALSLLRRAFDMSANASLSQMLGIVDHSRAFKHSAGGRVVQPEADCCAVCRADEVRRS
jgi:2-(1,2-epoxy-1,2-dihydrophenyl)acetyl-CoA isomerase